MPSKPQGQDEANRAVYFAPSVIKHYLSGDLTPQELTCVRHCHAQIAGRAVLDIGVGAGRTTHHLQPLAQRYVAIDYSPVMVDHMRRAMPHVSVKQADWRDLSAFEDASFDFIFATSNVIDALGHEDRLKALREARRLLRPDGVLAFSSHNREYQYAGVPPRLNWRVNPLHWPAAVAQYRRSVRNFQRIAPLLTETTEYALFNDAGHDYACVHYYASREIAVRQLEDIGLAVTAVIDARGEIMRADGDKSISPNFLYLAKR